MLQRSTSGWRLRWTPWPRGSKICRLEQVEEAAVRVVSESGHVRGLTEITNVFDKSEVALILACGVRRYQEYQALKGKREDKDIISYRQLQKKFGTNKRTLMEVVQGYKYRYPGGVSTKVPFTATKPGGGRGSPSHKPNGPSERPQHNISPYGTTTKFSVLSGPPNPPKVEYTLEKLSVDTLVKLAKGNVDALLFGK